MFNRVILLVLTVVALLFAFNSALASENAVFDLDTVSRIDPNAIIIGAQKLLDCGYAISNSTSSTSYWKGSENDNDPKTLCYISIYELEANIIDQPKDDADIKAYKLYNDSDNCYQMVFWYNCDYINISIYCTYSIESYQPIVDELNLIMNAVTGDG